MEVTRQAARALLVPTIALAAAGTVLHALWLLGLGHPALNTLIDEWVYNGVVVLTGAACLLRALAVAGGRAPWIAFGLGLLAWAAGDIYWSANFEDAVRVPAPSWADARLLSALHSEAVTDSLTGLRNRRKLSGDLERLLDPPSGAGPYLFALFDLDGFKGYNDAYGHPVGDALLYPPRLAPGGRRPARRHRLPLRGRRVLHSGAASRGRRGTASGAGADGTDRGWRGVLDHRLGRVGAASGRGGLGAGGAPARRSPDVHGEERPRAGATSTSHATFSRSSTIASRR